MFTIVPLGMFLMAGWSVIEPLRKYIIGTRTYYMLTNQRAVILTLLPTMQVRSFYDENIDRIDVRYSANKVGSIIFSTEQVTREIHNRNQNGFRVTFENGGMNFGTSNKRHVTSTVYHGFMAIDDVRTVEDLFSQVFFADDKSS